MRFGVQIENHLGISYEVVEAIGKEAEKLGFNGLFICDHLQGRTDQLARQNCLDTWTTLGALAASTRKIDLGTLVSAVGFRHPSLLAKMSSTVDHISQGRLKFAIGAGWYEPEYTSYGIPFPSVGRRMQELRDAIHIIRTMWTRDKATFAGKTNSIKDAWCYPRPINPTIWVGGTGEKLLLRIVADLADGWNAAGTTIEEYEHKLKVLKEYCKAAGRDIERIERSYYSTGLTGGNDKEFQDAFHQYYAQYKRSEESMESFVQRVRTSSRSFIGTWDEVAEKIANFSKLGVQYIIFYFPDKDPARQMKQFAEHVIAPFRN